MAAEIICDLHRSRGERNIDWVVTEYDENFMVPPYISSNYIKAGLL